MGSCRWCADGFAINTLTGKCASTSIANCNRFESTTCRQCKQGFRENPSNGVCIPYCSVKNCLKCPKGPCLECRAGFSAVNRSVNGRDRMFCLMNPCSVANCTYCNSTGACIQCMNRFTLQADGTCRANCSSIANCIQCATGATTCT